MASQPRSGETDIADFTARSGERLDQRDVLELQRVLEERVGRDEPDAAGRSKRPTITRKQIVKITAGIAIVAAFGWIPLQSLLQRSSVEAVVNSRIVTLRAPIDGRVTTQEALSSQEHVARGEIVLHVANTRADRTRLDDLRIQLARLENDRPSLAAKLYSARKAQQDLAQQAERFREGRIKQLEARIAELKSIIAAAGARREEATAAVERATSLIKSGSVSSVDLARLTRERTVAEQTEVGAQNRLNASEVELTFARQGTFLGDSYNDRPGSVQREEEMRERVAILSADIATTDAQSMWLRNEIALAQSRFDMMANAPVMAPVDGRVWEVMTSPGEDVRAGQPLLRILNCSDAVVTANVTESVYNDLAVGQKAIFRPTASGQDLQGTIVNLTGSAGVAANLAINPDVLSKEAYRVIVSVPQLARTGEDCTVGRTGRVIFSGGKSVATP